MKRLAIAVLFLFVASLIGGAFADSCLAMPRSKAGVETRVPPCCAMKAACVGGSCSSSASQKNCAASTGSSAVQESEARSLVKFVASVVPHIPTLTPLAFVASPRPPTAAIGFGEIVHYGDMFARTGRLLI